MREHEELTAYEEEAEDIYDDYNNEYEEEYEGDEPFYDDDEDYEDEFYDEEEEEDYEDEFDEYIPYEDDIEYDTYRTSSVGRIDPNDRTITVVVNNSTDTPKEAIIFGGNEEPAQADGVTVTVEESSHKEVQEESKSNPFKISGLKLSVNNELQLDAVLKITRKTATGSNTTRVFQPRTASSPQNFSSKMIDAPTFECDVTGSDSIRLTIMPNTTAVFTFTIKARANMGNILKGGSVAEVSQTPRPTGLPQIDLVRRRPKRRVRRRPVRTRSVPIRKKRSNRSNRRVSNRRYRPSGQRKRRFAMRRLRR